MSERIECLDVSLTPVEFERLGRSDLSRTTCIVLDILRATTSITAAFENGARSVKPVPDIESALAERGRNPGCVLAGEREGERIGPAMTGGTEFDLGNSPLEFERSIVDGRDIAITTTNGSRALHACRSANELFAGSLPNREAVISRIETKNRKRLQIVCSGTGEDFSFEDALGAGAYVDWLLNHSTVAAVSDAAWTVRELYKKHVHDLIGAMQFAANGRRLLAHPKLSPDVAFCLQLDCMTAVPIWSDGKLVA